MFPADKTGCPSCKYNTAPGICTRPQGEPCIIKPCNVYPLSHEIFNPNVTVEKTKTGKVRLTLKEYVDGGWVELATAEYCDILSGDPKENFGRTVVFTKILTKKMFTLEEINRIIFTVMTCKLEEHK